MVVMAEVVARTAAKTVDANLKKDVHTILANAGTLMRRLIEDNGRDYGLQPGQRVDISLDARVSAKAERE